MIRLGALRLSGHGEQYPQDPIEALGEVGKPKKTGARSWEPASAQEQRAQMHSVHVVHLHELYGRTSLRRQPMQPSVLAQGEVFSP